MNLENEYWKKKKMESCFEVPMGSYDGVEICDYLTNKSYNLFFERFDFDIDWQ